MEKLHFAGTIITINKILKPKSKHIEYLKAREGDKFALNLILGDNRRYATYINITNISHPDRPSKTFTQMEFFNSLQTVFEFV